MSAIAVTQPAQIFGAVRCPECMRIVPTQEHSIHFSTMADGILCHAKCGYCGAELIISAGFYNLRISKETTDGYTFIRAIQVALEDL